MRLAAIARLLPAFLLCAPTALPQGQRLTVKDIFNLELAADPRISPDGKRVVYVRQFADIMDDRR